MYGDIESGASYLVFAPPSSTSFIGADLLHLAKHLSESVTE